MKEYIEKFWRDATVSDVERAAIGTVNARFRDVETDPWYSNDGSCELKGVKVEGAKGLLWLARGSGWRYCQVYAPDQWFLDKPDPGDEFRLLGKFPDEPVQGGDFAWYLNSSWIKLNHGCEPDQQLGIWYRRRIEQPKPEPAAERRLMIGDTVLVVTRKRWNGVLGKIIESAKDRKDRSQWCVESLINPSARCWFGTDELQLANDTLQPEPSVNVPESPNSSSPVSKLVSCLSQRMQNDQDLAWTWHCNIVAASLDEDVDHETANRAAARFMSVAFGVDVTAFDEWSRFDWAKKPPKPEPKHYTLQVGDTVSTPSGHRITITEQGVEVT